MKKQVNIDELIKRLSSIQVTPTTITETKSEAPISLTENEKKTIFDQYKNQVPEDILKKDETIESVVLPLNAKLKDMPENILRRVAEETLTHNEKEENETKKEEKILSENNCELIITKEDPKNIPGSRLISFLTQDLNENKRPVVICFDVVELYEAAQKSNSAGERVLVPNVALNHMSKEQRVRFNYDFSHFTRDESNRIYNHFDEYSELVQSQHVEDSSQVRYFIDFFIAPTLKGLFTKAPELFEAIFGKTFLKTAAYIFYPVTWIVQQGWFAAKKIALSPIGSILSKIFSSAVYYIRFIANNAFIINTALYLFSILRVIICVYFMGPTVGLRSIKEWLDKQQVIHEASRWSKIIYHVLYQIVECLVGVGTVNFFIIFKTCFWGVFTIKSAETSVNIFVSFIHMLRSYFHVDTLQQSTESEEEIKKIALDIMNMDWAILGNIMTMLLPKLILFFLGFFPLPPHIYTIIKPGLQLVNTFPSLYITYSSMIHFVYHILSQVRECLNFSGNCCFPKSLKDAYTNELKVASDTAESRTFWSKLFGGRAYTQKDILEERNLLASDSMNRQSDDRSKIKLGYSGLTVCGLKIYLYVMSPTFFHKFRSFKKKRSLPPWLQRLYQDTYFRQNEFLFYSVSAQETQKKYPRAVKEFKTRSLSVLYLVNDELPEKLHMVLIKMNALLLTEPLKKRRKIFKTKLKQRHISPEEY